MPSFTCSFLEIQDKPAIALHYIRAFKHLQATDVLHSQKPPNCIGLPTKRSMPTWVSTLHWFLNAAVLHFIQFILRHTCISVSPFMICQQRRYREGNILSDQAQSMWKSEISQTWPWNKFPKNRTDHFYSMTNQSKLTWEINYLFALK